MKISIIVPTYNEEEVIGGCLKSLAQQTYKDMEIIVVDDGSTDNSKLKIQNSKLQLKIQNLKLLEQRHNGPGVARNLGAKEATGKILVFVDADMTFEQDFIEGLVAPIVKGEARGTFSKEEFVSNADNTWSQCWGINEGWEEGRRHPKNYPDTQKVFRAILKNEFDKTGGFSQTGYTDDWTLSEKLGYEAIAAPGAKFYHKNPETLGEVFSQSKWVAKRPYKLGVLGQLIGIIRVLLPISLAIGSYKATIHTKPQFLLFKIIYDLGTFIGILEYVMLGRGAK